MAEKYLGYVTDKIPGNDESKGANAILKVVAIRENGNFRKLSSEEAKECCSPNGYVFGPLFFNSHNLDFCESSFIEFEISPSQEKERKVINQTDYIVNYASRPKAVTLPRLVSYNGKLNEILSKGYLAPDEINAAIDKQNVFEGKDTKFFLWDSVEQKGIGVFKYKNSSDTIESNYGKDVQEFKIPNDGVVSDLDGRNYLLFNEKQNNLARGSVIDFMTNQQLSDWFKAKLKNIASIDKKALSLICEFPESQPLEDDRDAVRFERLKEKSEAFEIDIQVLIELICTHPKYFSQFVDNIDLIEKEVKENFEKKYIQDAAEIIKENQEKIKKQEAKILKLDDTLETEKTRVSTEIESVKAKLEKKNEVISKQIDEKSAQLKAINENYDSVIAAISVIAPVLNSSERPSSIDEKCKISSFEFPKNEKAHSYSQIKAESDESFVSFMKRHVYCENEKFVDYLKQVKRVFSHRACFIPNTALAYLFAKALRNTKVMIMNIEHDWLHYSDFVEHGLLKAFNEANENSEKNFILVLDGLNITQPECGLRPLLNLINGDVPILEECEFGFPKNMTVMATLISSTSENAVGLKLDSSFYNKWFAIGDPADESCKISLPENFWEDKEIEDCGYTEPSDLPKEFVGEKSELLDKYFEF